MKKKWCEIVGTIILATGVIVLPLLKGYIELNERLTMVLVCSVTIFLILAVRIIGYKTGYSYEEKKDDRLNFLILLFLLIILLLDGLRVVICNNMW